MTVKCVIFKNKNAMVCGSSTTLSEEERKMIKMKIVARHIHIVNSSWHFLKKKIFQQTKKKRKSLLHFIIIKLANSSLLTDNLISYC